MRECVRELSGCLLQHVLRCFSFQRQHSLTSVPSCAEECLNAGAPKVLVAIPPRLKRVRVL